MVAVETGLIVRITKETFKNTEFLVWESGRHLCFSKVLGDSVSARAGPLMYGLVYLRLGAALNLGNTRFPGAELVM